MKITILCSSDTHPINPYLATWMKGKEVEHEVELVRKKADAKGGDLLFLISCAEIVTHQGRSNYANTLVIHASDLPKGRGWSPHIWQILEGKSNITVTLLEAKEKVDSGDIWQQITCHIPDHALWDEINDSIFTAELCLIDYAIKNYATVVPQRQSGEVVPTYYPRRSPAQSELDPQKSLAEQFDIMRVSDPDRFPAFFCHRGHEYKIRLEKISNE